jgi:ABC-type sugar transport system substrate-binding protein
LVSLTTDKEEFQLSQAAAAENAARQLGVPVEVLFAEANAVLQIHQLFQRIREPEEKRPLAFVLEPVNDAGLERLCRNTVGAGIGWLALNSGGPYLADLRRQHPTLPICSILTDQVEAGRVQGRQIRALLPQGGTVLFVHGPATSQTEERRRGTEEVMQGAGVRLLQLSGTWSEDSGEKAVRAWARLKTTGGDRVDLLAAQNDLMAVGARKALIATRPELAGIPVLGIDGLPSGGQKLVTQKQLTATVVMPANAGRAVEVVAEWLRSGRHPPEMLRQSPEPYPALDRLEQSRPAFGDR